MEYKSAKFMAVLLGVAVFCASASAHAEMTVSCKTMIKDASRVIRDIRPDTRLEIFDVEPDCFEGKLILGGVSSSPELVNELKRNLSGNVSAIIDEVIILPAGSDLNGHSWGLISAPVATMNSVPKFASPPVTQAVMGTPVKVLRKNGAWIQVQTPDGYLGWIHPDQLERLSEKELGSWNASDLVMTTESHSKLTSPDGERAGYVPAGSLLKLMKREGTQLLVQLPSGKTAEVSADKAVDFRSWANRQKELYEKSPEDFKTNLVSTAKSFLGTSYLWGGTSSLAMDCSGLISSVYRLNGLVIPRDSDMQGNIDGAFKKNTDQGKTDLLLFGNVENNTPIISHIGIAADGDRFVHSLGTVRWGSLKEGNPDYDDYEKKRFLYRLELSEKFIDGKCVSWMADNPFYSANPHNLGVCRPASSLENKFKASK